MLVTKADGTVEAFDPAKLRNSLKSAGAPKETVNDIVAQVEAIMHDGMRTGDIYRHAFSLLRSAPVPVTARYALRRALFGLGPTGFPFEAFLGKLFQKYGYETRTGVTIQGRCALHEVDLAAFKADHAFIAEAKFHVRPGIKSDLQVAMYSYARLLDLGDQKICQDDICGVKNLKVITNTKFTRAAVDYAHCVGVELLSWDYPKTGNLYQMIEEHKLYPVTVLRGLSAAQKQLLLSQGVILCEDLIQQPQVLNELRLSARKMEALIMEARQLSPGA